MTYPHYTQLWINYVEKVLILHEVKSKDRQITYS